MKHIYIALTLGLSSGLLSHTFAQQNDYRQSIQAQVSKRLQERKQAWKQGTLFAPLQQKMSQEELQAMQFLYAYMPLSDIADYTGAFHLKNVQTALQAKREMPWGNSIPQQDFYHFVLPTRVNNEGLDSARWVLYSTLKERVQHLPLEQAVIEINRWCHEHVTYTPSDARTSSPLATIKSAYGRCGEESTLLVTALRTVGIPARQVYTPRWAHTDDNHAWVEAWVNGTWKFLGACEPEAVLNLGWFNAPASRAMLVHTKAFGAYQGTEPIISQNDCATEINVTKGYAPVSNAAVQVLDHQGRAVKGASVEFKIYNYGEFYTVGKQISNHEGKASFLAGHGDMLVWASYGNKFGFTKVSFGKDSTTPLILKYKAGDKISEDINITPPVESAKYPTVSPEARAENTRLLAREDSIRNAYVAGFLDKQIENLDARGNWATLQSFIKHTPDAEKAKNLLSVISAKDRRDATEANLQDHLQNTIVSPAYTTQDSALVWQYIYSPRISTEVMSPYKGYFNKNVTPLLRKEWQANSESLVLWCKSNLTLSNESNPHNQPIQPIGVWTARRGDKQSLAIFFVAMARSMGHAARINDITGKTQYYAPQQKAWIDVTLGDEKQSTTSSPQGTLYLNYTDNGIVQNPTYYTHFSISKIDNRGQLALQSYDLDDKGLEQGASWAGLFRKGVKMEQGEYLLVSGSRMASGNVLAHIESFSINKDKTTTADLRMRRDSTQVAVIGNFDAESKYQHLGSVAELSTQTQLNGQAETLRSILSTTGRGYYILGIIGAQHEPSNHALRDLSTLEATLNDWGRPMLLLFADKEQKERYRPEEFPNLPKAITLGIDNNNQIRKQLIKEFKLVDHELPIFIIADTFNRVVYVKQGYTIGLGEQLKSVIAGLQSPITESGACTRP